MQQLLLIIHVLVAIAVVALVLIQHGKGADMGAAFGSGASSTMFGSQGTTPFLVKLTGGLAIIFFITSLALNYLVSSQPKEINAGVPVPLIQENQRLPESRLPTDITQEKSKLPNRAPGL